MNRKSISGSSSVEPDAESDDDFDEAPELGRDFFERAQIRFKGHILREADGTFTKRGRPPLGDAAKIQQSLRLSPDVLDYFRSTGPGWQARIDDVLRIHVRMVGEMRRSVAEALQARPRVAEEQEGFRGEGGGDDPERSREGAGKRVRPKPAEVPE